jgi:sigma-B regulation protein RsbU (phosphoserine phosphatase)
MLSGLDPRATSRQAGTAAVLEQFRQELEQARDVQQRLFPGRLPGVPGWECAALCRPARIVSGDYYDLFEVATGHLVVALGDVAGKGLGAALVMAGLHALIRSALVCPDVNLGKFVEGLNCYLVDSTPQDMFVTLILGILNVRTGLFRYVNAGHPAGVVLAPRAAEEESLATGGPVLGTFPRAPYTEGQTALRPGSLLTLFSDGITDAGDRDGRRFGKTRLHEALHTVRSAPAAQALASLVEAVDRFTGRAEQSDDLSLVVLCRQAPRRGKKGLPSRAVNGTTVAV